MKIRLQITASTGSSFSFEHQGPEIRIGRNPEGELTLLGDASQSVSWDHARINLSSREAAIVDLNSSNGTFVNDKRITERTNIERDDQIHLGHTGPVMKIVELDLTELRSRPAVAAPSPPPVPTVQEVVQKTVHPAAVAAAEPVRPAVASAPGPRAARVDPWAPAVLTEMQRTQRNMFIGFGAIAGVLLLLGAFFVYKSRQPADKPNETLSASANKEHLDVPPRKEFIDSPPAPVLPTAKTNSSAKNQNKPNKPLGDLPPPEAGPADAPSVERRDIGRYVAPAKTPPSVLVERQSDPYPWGQLKPETRVHTSNYLVSLPGYRSTIALDSDVVLTLWGNVPEFSNFPPVLESTVMLYTPPSGKDLDFTLERGRVLISSNKKSGAANIRVRFHHEMWDLTLPDSTSEVAIELWGMYPRNVGFQVDPKKSKGPTAWLGLFVSGKAQLKTGTQEYQLSNLSEVTWSNSGKIEGPKTMPGPPAWWTNKLDPKSPPVAEAMLSLKDYYSELSKTDALLDKILTQVRDSHDPANRSLGVLFLAALDALVPLVEGLEDRQYPEVRGTAAYALRHWISLGKAHDLELYRTLVEKKGYSKEKAEIIMRLLHDVSETDAAKPETYATLIGYLNHENLAIRDLAYWHLSLLAPDGAKQVPYDPSAEPDKRKLAFEQWKKLVPDGQVPPARSK